MPSVQTTIKWNSDLIAHPVEPWVVLISDATTDNAKLLLSKQAPPVTDLKSLNTAPQDLHDSDVCFSLVTDAKADQYWTICNLLSFAFICRIATMQSSTIGSSFQE